MSRYIHHENTENVVGYIVNVHDPVNYDIDLLFNDELRQRYWNVITNTYVYTDDVDERGQRNEREHNGMTYRCRLKGIGINSPVLFDGRPDAKMKTSKKTRKYQTPALREATITMIRQFDRFNGWVICTVSDVDVYRRLLITIRDPISHRDIRDLLFAESPALFCPYELETPIEELLNENSLSSDDEEGVHPENSLY